jgi:ankyrin repeat protein
MPSITTFLTPLHIATSKGQISVVEMILKEVTDKNPAKNDGILTPLHLAALIGDMNLLELIAKDVKELGIKDKR